MWWPIIIGAAIGTTVGALFGASIDRRHPVPTPTPTVYQCPVTGSRVLFIGDSYAEGLAPQMIPMASECSTPYVPDGRRGTSVTQWAREDWIGPALATSQANVVLISLGGNDFQRNDVESVRSSIDKLLARIRAAGARPLWVEPLSLPFADKIGVRQMWKSAMGSDWFPSEHLQLDRAPDGIHLGGAGYKTWAQEIWPWMAGKTHGT